MVYGVWYVNIYTKRQERGREKNGKYFHAKAFCPHRWTSALTGLWAQDQKKYWLFEFSCWKNQNLVVCRKPSPTCWLGRRKRRTEQQPHNSINTFLKRLLIKKTKKKRLYISSTWHWRIQICIIWHILWICTWLISILMSQALTEKNISKLGFLWHRVLPCWR